MFFVFFCFFCFLLIFLHVASRNVTICCLSLSFMTVNIDLLSFELLIAPKKAICRCKFGLWVTSMSIFPHFLIIRHQAINWLPEEVISRLNRQGNNHSSQLYITKRTHFHQYTDSCGGRTSSHIIKSIQHESVENNSRKKQHNQYQSQSPWLYTDQ